MSGGCKQGFGWDLAKSRGCPVHPPAQRPQARGLAGTLTQTLRAPRHPAARAWGPGGHCACTHPIASTRTSGHHSNGPASSTKLMHRGVQGLATRSLKGTAWFFLQAGVVCGWGMHRQGFGWDLAISRGCPVHPPAQRPQTRGLCRHTHMGSIRVPRHPAARAWGPGGHCACTHPIASTRTSATTARLASSAKSMHRGVQGLATRCLKGTAWFFFCRLGWCVSGGCNTRFWLGFGHFQGVPSSPPGAKAPDARPLQTHSHRAIRVPRHPAARAWGPGEHGACTHPIASTRTSTTTATGSRPAQATHAQGGPGPSH